MRPLVPRLPRMCRGSLFPKISFATLFLLLFALAAAQPITMKRTPKVGDMLNYKVSIIFTLYGDDIVYQSTLSERVTDVAKDGSYTVQSNQTGASANNGRDIPIVQSQAQTSTTYDPRGMILAIPSDYSWRDAYLGEVVLPDKPVKPGETYSVQFPARADRTTPAATVTYTVEQLPKDRVDGFDTIVLDEKYTESTGTYPATSEGRVWINPADGTVVKLDENWRNAPLMGTHTIVNAHVSYDRVVS